MFHGMPYDGMEVVAKPQAPLQSGIIADQWYQHHVCLTFRQLEARRLTISLMPAPLMRQSLEKGFPKQLV